MKIIYPVYGDYYLTLYSVVNKQIGLIMKTQHLNRWRWILLVLSIVFFFLIEITVDIRDYIIAIVSAFFLWIISCIGLLILFIYKNSTISPAIRKTLIIIIPVSVTAYLFLNYLIWGSNLVEYITAGVIFIMLSSMILSLIILHDRIEWILSGLVFTLIAGFILNRLGVNEGQYIIIFSFLLSSLGFIYLLFKTISVFKTNKKAGRVLFIFYSVNGILNALLFLKFNEFRPAFFSIYDILGVVIFIVACLVLFIILPLSDFTEWPRAHKQSFKRLVVTPLIVFLIIFSLKFLLPDSTYKRIFFKEYSESKKTYFDMKDYEIDFSKHN